MLKRLFESYLFFSRWLLAPFFVMLTIGLLALMLKAGRTTWKLVHLLVEAQDEYVALELLDLIDLTLTGALVVLVTLSVYENFVSEVADKEKAGWPEWMSSIDFSQLKLRLLSTIVAISAIKLLEAFMDIPQMSDRDLYFYIGIHLTFVVSTAIFAISERLSEHSHEPDEPPHGYAAPADPAPDQH